MNLEKVVVRPFMPQDIESLKRICNETACFGKGNKLTEDKEMFAELFLNPFVKYSKEGIWIADSNGEVLGYLTGATGRKFEMYSLLSMSLTAMKMIWRTRSWPGSGVYDDQKSKEFIWRMIKRARSERPRRPNISAMFHVNVSLPYTRREFDIFDSQNRHLKPKRIVLALMGMFEEQLQSYGIQEYYGESVVPAKLFDSRSRMYRRVGLEIFDWKENSWLRNSDPENIYTISLRKVITPKNKIKLR